MGFNAEKLVLAKKKAYLWMRLYDKLSLNNDMIYRGSEVAKKVARA